MRIETTRHTANIKLQQMQLWRGTGLTCYMDSPQVFSGGKYIVVIGWNRKWSWRRKGTKEF